MLDALVIDDGLPYNITDLSSKFNKKKFFEKEFYPVSLFYLGMTTLKSTYRMVLPNMTMRSIYMDYYNQLNKKEMPAVMFPFMNFMIPTGVLNLLFRITLNNT